MADNVGRTRAQCGQISVRREWLLDGSLRFDANECSRGGPFRSIKAKESPATRLRVLIFQLWPSGGMIRFLLPEFGPGSRSAFGDTLHAKLLSYLGHRSTKLDLTVGYWRENFATKNNERLHTRLRLTTYLLVTGHCWAHG